MDHLKLSDDSDDQAQVIADPDTSGTVITGAGFGIVQEEEFVPVSSDWCKAPTFAQQREMQNRERAFALMTSWMTDIDRHMLDIKGLSPVPWENFGERWCNWASRSSILMSDVGLKMRRTFLLRSTVRLRKLQ
jgi:hypothetical protein